MRVISGTHRSRKLFMVDDPSTRETKDRVKESMFNMIGPYQSNEHVLDLFAGSGSLGIETFSRGAKHVYFIDQSKKAIDTIKKNVTQLHMNDSSTVLQMDSKTFIQHTDQTFDIILLDPPYEKVPLEECLTTIRSRRLLKDDGLVVILTDQHTELADQENLIIVKKRRVTRTNVVLMKWGK
jgi:16S rRNA (guanine(966)-N(2))-methyltransferase RsmD